MYCFPNEYLQKINDHLKIPILLSVKNLLEGSSVHMFITLELDRRYCWFMMVPIIGNQYCNNVLSVFSLYNIYTPPTLCCNERLSRDCFHFMMKSHAAIKASHRLLDLAKCFD
jgi:hypothetical protein